MDKTSYALGMSIANNLMQSGVTRLDFDDVRAGLEAMMTGAKPALLIEEAGAALDAFFKDLEKRQAVEAADIAGKMKEEGEAFLKVNATREGVKVLPSGLQYKILKAGFGKTPGPASKVRCHYEGKFVDGRVFDSSYQRGEPAVFGVNQVIAGWTEALQLMPEGSKWELYIPYQLAYGEAGAHGAIPPCAALTFVVELIAVL